MSENKKTPNKSVVVGTIGSDAHVIGGWVISEAFKAAGYKVSLTEHTPGEVDGIQELFVNQAKHTRMFRTYTPLELKMQESLTRPTAP